MMKAYKNGIGCIESRGDRNLWIAGGHWMLTVAYKELVGIHSMKRRLQSLQILYGHWIKGKWKNAINVVFSSNPFNSILL